jgi:NAD(P)-dependent dehydrogenase (short-subunit alcohol dehydrogenase family)
MKRDAVSVELSLEGRTVLITGAASGLGLAFARGFLHDGARVFGAQN